MKPKKDLMAALKKRREEAGIERLSIIIPMAKAEKMRMIARKLVAKHQEDQSK